MLTIAAEIDAAILYDDEIGRHLSNNAGKQGRAMRASPVWNNVQRNTQ